tara:strand:- start:412 stop:1128 length:717 start_codon:yes stop_codon:yes gene_type:complete
MNKEIEQTDAALETLTEVVAAIPVPHIYDGMDVMERIWLFTQKFEGVEKSRTAAAGSFDYAYFNIDDLYAGAIPVMTECGIGAVDWIESLTAEGTTTPQQYLIVRLFCLSASGEQGSAIQSSILLPNGGDGRAFGSALTYMRRYGLVTMLNIRVPGDDDDGMAAEMERLANDVGSAAGKPLDKIREQIAQIDNGLERALAYVEKQWGIVTLDELSLKQSGSLQRTLADIIKREPHGAA